MAHFSPSRLKLIALHVGVGCCAITAITWFSFGVKRIVIPAFLFLLVVVLVSVWGEFASAAVVAVVAAINLEYFFIPPVLHWQIDDPEDVVVLAVCLATGLIITRLASKAREEATRAEEKRNDAARLYESASRLLTLNPEGGNVEASLHEIRQVFGMRAACFADAVSGTVHCDGESLHNLGEKTWQTHIEGREVRDDDTQLFVHRISSGERAIGTVGFEGPVRDEPLGLAIGALTATAVERVRAFRSATKAAADADAEMLRTAIVDAFAHEFKTPLAVILAAAGALRESLGARTEPRLTEMMDIIENQGVRLNQLSNRLLRTAKLDRDHVTLRKEPVSISALLLELVEQCREQGGRLIVPSFSSSNMEANADPVLLGLAIAQLLDNACKYSFPESLTQVAVEERGNGIHIFVSSEGPAIPEAEQERIFERFYRGKQTEHCAAGTGLGLFVARNILTAHGGTLEFDTSRSARRLTTFHLYIPGIENDRRQQQEIHQNIGG